MCQLLINSVSRGVNSDDSDKHVNFNAVRILTRKWISSFRVVIQIIVK